VGNFLMAFKESTQLLVVLLLILLFGGILFFQNKADPCPTDILYSTSSEFELLNASFRNQIEILNASLRVSFKKQTDKLINVVQKISSPSNQLDVTVPFQNQEDTILNTFEENKKINAFQCFNYNTPTSTRKQQEKDYISGVKKYQAFDMAEMEKYPDWQYYILQQKWTPVWTCETVRRLGSQGDGGKQICNLPYIADPCIVYSFGLLNETSFEKELKELAPHCQIYGFDHTVGDYYIENNITYLTFQGTGLASFDEGNFSSIRTIMKKLNHTHIDILKIDIEGSEWEFFPDFFQATFPVCQMSMEFHMNNISLALETVENLRKKKRI